MVEQIIFAVIIKLTIIYMVDEVDSKKLIVIWIMISNWRRKRCSCRKKEIRGNTEKKETEERERKIRVLSEKNYAVILWVHLKLGFSLWV